MELRPCTTADAVDGEENECKHWKAWEVNPKTVREMLGAITAAKLRAGIIFCWCGFTQDGHAKAAEHGITLVDAPSIVIAPGKSAPVRFVR